MNSNNKIHLIVACDKNWGIGKNNTMPWHFKKELQLFRSITVGRSEKKNAVVMGYKTWLSLPKKPLPNRINYVFTRKKDHKIEENQAIACHSLEDFLAKVDKNQEVAEIFVIGGEQIFKLFLREKRELIGNVYITHIPRDYHCDVFFSGKEEKLKLVEELEKIVENDVELQPIKYSLS